MSIYKRIIDLPGKPYRLKVACSFYACFNSMTGTQWTGWLSFHFSLLIFVLITFQKVANFFFYIRRNVTACSSIFHEIFFKFCKILNFNNYFFVVGGLPSRILTNEEQCLVPCFRSCSCVGVRSANPEESSQSLWSRDWKQTTEGHSRWVQSWVRWSEKSRYSYLQKKNDREIFNCDLFLLLFFSLQNMWNKILFFCTWIYNTGTKSWFLYYVKLLTFEQKQVINNDNNHVILSYYSRLQSTGSVWTQLDKIVFYVARELFMYVSERLQ